MKVLEPGTIHWKTNTRCTGKGNANKGCNALLEVEHQDLFFTTDARIGGRVDRFISFRCPECNSVTDVDGDVPYQNLIRESERATS